MNKSVPQSPKSVGSVSSETSETQSVSDELQSTTNNSGKNAKMAAAIAAAKGVKKPKEVERPPWRPGNSNTAALAAKNSLLKAKLLDASRRIARQSRQNNVYTQTDIVPTKLMKEISSDTNNLIKTRDQGILTDDTPILTIRDNLRGILILTHTVSQQTDFIEYNEKETQTPMPRSNISFTKYIKNLNEKSKNENFNNNNDSINTLNINENILLKQINDIIDIDKKLIEQNNHFFNDSMENLNQDDDNNNNNNVNENENNLEMQQAPDLISAVDGNISLQQPFLASPTYSSWQDIEDFSDNDNDLPELPRHVVSEGVKPWSDFKDLVLSKRLTNMKLSPITPRRPSMKKKNVTWSDKEHLIIKEFLHEANELLNIFDKVTMLLGPDININNNLPNISDIEIPEFKWDPILTNSCNLLDEKLQKIQPIHINETVENLNPELLNYLNINLNEEKSEPE